jgi:hypothetical protein
MKAAPAGTVMQPIVSLDEQICPSAGAASCDLWRWDFQAPRQRQAERLVLNPESEGSLA